MYYVYALYSVKYKKIYIGFTPNLEERLSSHNHPLNKGHTAKYAPWIIIFKEEHNNKRNAMLREKQLKSARGRAFIKSLITK